MAIGIVKVKVLAVLLGPSGIGLMGLYQNIMGMASTLAGCGVGRSGVRQLAASAGEAETLAIVRRTLWLGNLLLGIFGMALLWLLREPVAQWVFGSAAHANAVGWLSFGILLTLIAGSQTALLQGLRRIGDMARVNILSAFVGAAVGILAVYLLKEDGVLWFVLTAPAVTVLVAGYYAARLPSPQTPNDWAAIQQQWLVMLKMGIPLMAASLLTLITQLAARSIILRELGLDASGYFQAAWAISMTYIGFVLGAMVTDFYPRLTEAINDHERAGKLVNEQAEMALLLAGPALVVMISFAPWVIHLLYAESFAPAADILRWQVLGDILKVASWPMGIILAAKGRSSLTLLAEICWNGSYIAFIAIGIPVFGLVSSGIGFLFAYTVYYVFVSVTASKLIGYKSSKRIVLYVPVLLMTGFIVVLGANHFVSSISIPLGLLATALIGGYSLVRLNSLLNLRSLMRRRRR